MNATDNPTAPVTPSTLHQRIEAGLRQVIDPCSVGSANPMNIVEMGLIKKIESNDGIVIIHLCLTSPTCMMMEHFVAEARRILGPLDGVRQVHVIGDRGLDWTPDRIEPEAEERRRRHLSLLLARPAPAQGILQG